MVRVTASVDRDARDRERAEARLAEKGMWLENDFSDDRQTVIDAVVYRRQLGVPHERVEVARSKFWRQSVSEALGIPAF